MKTTRTDLSVGLFVVAVIGVIVAALVATSGWGVRHFDLYIRTDDARDVALDTRIYLQGLEVGRVASISPRPTNKRGVLEFIIRAQMIAEFENGDSLALPGNVEAEVQPLLLGGALLVLDIYSSNQASATCSYGINRALVQPGDTICMHRRPGVAEAFGNLALDLKADIANAIVATTRTVEAYGRLARNLEGSTGEIRTLVNEIRPGAVQTMAQLSSSLERMRRLLDTADVRSATTLAELNQSMQQTRATMEQARLLLVSTDSLTRLVTDITHESRPDIRAMLQDARFMTQQLLYVTEQLSRRPMRAMSGVELPDTLTIEGRARRAADSTARTTGTSRDTTRGGP